MTTNLRALLQLLDDSHQRDQTTQKFSLAPTSSCHLLPGETVIVHLDGVYCYETLANGVACGCLHVTSYKVAFTGSYVTLRDETTDVPESGDQDVEPERVARRGWKSQKVKERKQMRRLKKTVSTFFSLEPRKNELGSKSEGFVRSSAFTLSHRSHKRANISQNVTESQPFLNSCDNSHARMDGLISPSATYPIAKENEVSQWEVELAIPLTEISAVKKGPGLTLSEERIKLEGVVRIICSTGQLYQFGLQPMSSYKADSLKAEIKNHMKPQYFAKLFAFCYQNALSSALDFDILESSRSLNVYSLAGEAERMNVMGSHIWRITELFESLCVTYPREIIVPSCVADIDLIKVANFHRFHRLPAICWLHTISNAIMLRAAGTISRRGKAGTHSEHDEAYLHAVCMLSSSSLQDGKLWIFTDRLQTNASKPTAIHKLSREEAKTFYYPECKFVYSFWDPDVETHKAVRASFKQLQYLMHSKVESSRYLSALEETGWFEQLHQLLETAVNVALVMDEYNSSVLIAYEDGWDRTPQVTSLSQLLLDPYYRTIDGFQVLIQKEWLSFGHKFTSRHAPWLTKSKEDGPVFLQWLDCVWQVLQQFTRQFEFNETFLRVIAEHAYSSRFGSFLMDSDRERATEDLHKGTVSLWHWLYLVNETSNKFRNKLYELGHVQRVLYPQTSVANLKLWESQYCGYKQEENISTAKQLAQEQQEKLLQDYKDLKKQYTLLCERTCLTVEDSFARILPDAAGMLTKSNFESSMSVLKRRSCVYEQEAFEQYDAVYRRLERVEEDDSVKAAPQALDQLDDEYGDEDEDDDDDDDSENVAMVSSEHRPRLTLSLSPERLSPNRSHSMGGGDKRVRSPEAFLPEVDLVNHVKMKGLTSIDDNEVRLSKSTCFGYLTKIGGRRKTWRKRWFVLDLSKRFLAYFEDEKAAERKQAPRGVIKLADVIEVFRYAKKENGFGLRTPKRTYLIQSPSLEAMQTWIACLTVGKVA